ncbi:hypothetical protein GYW21_10050 [Lactobacillus mellis]|nr:hypothetical protein [Bombilactobacillus mellis]
MNNNEKIINLLRGYEKLQELMPSYLNNLQQIKLYDSQIRSFIRQIKVDILLLETEINKRLNQINKNQQQLQDYLLQVKKEAADLNEIFFDSNNKYSGILTEISTLQATQINTNYLNKLSDLLVKERTVKTTELQQELEQMNRLLNHRPEEYTILKNSALQAAELSTQVISYHHFQLSNDKTETLLQLQQLIATVSALDIDSNSVSSLKSAVNSLISLKQPQMPDPLPLIETIHVIRNPKNYISRGYTVLEMVKPVYAALTRLRKGLVNHAQYRGMNNSWQHYVNTMDNLNDYYQQHYWQKGGTPNNFHGHDSR